MSADDGAVEASLCLEELSVDVAFVVLEISLALFRRVSPKRKLARELS